MEKNDRRRDQQSSEIFSESLQMQRVFGKLPALVFLKKLGVNEELARAVLMKRYGRRIIIRRKIFRSHT
jgi:hypothetical protein